MAKPKRPNLDDQIKKLEEIADYFQNPDFAIDAGIAKHAEALTLAKEILEYLDSAEQTLQQVDIAALTRPGEEGIRPSARRTEASSE
jgi:exonuclease VII small subunit